METIDDRPTTFKYRYKALGADGQTIRGTIHVETPQGARNLLAQRGLTLTDLRRSGGARFSSGRNRRLAVMHFIQQLASFVDAGVPVQSALRALGKQIGRPDLRLAVRDITARVDQGEKLSMAFATHPDVFPEFMANLFVAAESTGDLAAPLRRLGRYLERDADSRRDVRQAMQYPAMVVLIGLAAAMVIVFFVFPQLQSSLRILRVDMPTLPARIFAVAEFVRSNTGFLVLAVVTVLAVVVVLLRTAPGRRARTRFVLRTPLIGDILKAAAIEQASRLLALMIGSGVTVPNALDITAMASRHEGYRRALLQVHGAVTDGESIASAFADTNCFPPPAVEMVSVGEQSGQLRQQLDNCADFYEKELTYYIKRLTALIEPIALVVLGLAVVFFGIIIIMALYGSLVQIGRPF
ncbi:MAG: type II secretion system F family protein [Candidatus Nanopelagicales bacterium]|nr:type II secretion system F family protein [Candidatus Nanopelagicales bacterium]